LKGGDAMVKSRKGEALIKRNNSFEVTLSL
jgi:hypothetical protein